jgi:acyl homoserine lactone synthase
MVPAAMTREPGMRGNGAVHYRAVFCTEDQNRDLVDALLRFRKKLFVDLLAWDLPVTNGRERDQFDNAAAIHCALFADEHLTGGFRAIRSDHEYLAQSVFPHLATLGRFPRRRDVWEISRFGVLPGRRRLQTARTNYALMFHFAQRRQASALVAVVDVNHERFLGMLGIRTRRYGPPQTIGIDRNGQIITGVAGEIPVTEQGNSKFLTLLATAQSIEVNDETLVLGSERVSA